MVSTSKKHLLIQAIENLSDEEIAIALRVVTGLIYSSESYTIEPVPKDDPNMPRYLEILKEMDEGEYVEL